MIQVNDIPAPPDRPDDSHKGSFGTVIVVGGCATMIGAPAISARAAIRGGAGLVKIAVPKSLVSACLSVEPCATAIALDSDPQKSVRQIKESDRRSNAVLAIGPGLSDDQDARRMVRSLIELDIPMVVDADGLNHLADLGVRMPRRDKAKVLTPHPGEFERLAKPHGLSANPTDPQQRTEAAMALAKVHDAVVVLKGRRTVVSDGEHCFINETGNPCLATGGSGDVLTGLLASLLAQHMSAFDAACLAVNAHGLAADQWQQRHGSAGLRAIDLADELPTAMQSLRHRA